MPHKPNRRSAEHGVGDHQTLGERDRQALPTRCIVDSNLPDEDELNRQRGHQREDGEVMQEGEECGHGLTDYSKNSRHTETDANPNTWLICRVIVDYKKMGGAKVNIVAEGIQLLARYRGEIAGYLAKILHRVKYGKERILIVGAGGVGKTTLGRFLSGQEVTAGKEYDESINIEHFDYDGRVFGSLIVAPGQQRRREFHWPTLRQEIAQGKILAVIFVVAAGYNSLREIEPSEHEVYKNGMTPEQFIDAFRHHNMENDLRILREELSQAMKDAPGRLWFVTAILKQDLWSENEKSVMDYYKRGPHAKAVNEIAESRGPHQFVHECVPASLLIENLQTNHGTVFASTAAGYDSAKQLESTREFIRQVSEVAVDREVRG